MTGWHVVTAYGNPGQQATRVPPPHPVSTNVHGASFDAVEPGAQAVAAPVPGGQNDSGFVVEHVNWSQVGPPAPAQGSMQNTPPDLASAAVVPTGPGSAPPQPDRSTIATRKPMQDAPRTRQVAIQVRASRSFALCKVLGR